MPGVRGCAVCVTCESLLGRVLVRNPISRVMSSVCVVCVRENQRRAITAAVTSVRRTMSLTEGRPPRAIKILV